MISAEKTWNGNILESVQLVACETKNKYWSTSWLTPDGSTCKLQSEEWEQEFCNNDNISPTLILPPLNINAFSPAVFYLFLVMTFCWEFHLIYLSSPKIVLLLERDLSSTAARPALMASSSPSCLQYSNFRKPGKSGTANLRRKPEQQLIF